MKEFFQGWRRKLGVATLVMALVFIGCWIRGFYVEDWMFVSFDNRTYLLRSDRGGFSCNRCDTPIPAGTPLHGSQPVMQIVVLVTGPVSPDDFFVYYSGLAIPLTLLSTYLIFWKPRKRDSGPTQS
jgi:hypothetical protein